MEQGKKVISYFCPFCDEEHEIEIITEESKAIIKGKVINYIKTVYYCPKEDEEFCPSKLMNKNLLIARDEYRRSEKLLTSQEIIEIREQYGLNQKEFSNLLGWGDVTIQRYETKKIQDSTYDNIMRIALDNPSYCLSMIEKNKENYSATRYEQIKNNIKQVIKTKGNLYLKTEEIKNSYIDYDKESDLNGYKLLDINKVNSVIGYFANYIKPLYKVKLMKLLWFTDQLSYKIYNNSITGLVYQHLPLGAVPIGYNELLELPSIKVNEEMYNDYIAYNICPNREINLNEFTLEELNILQQVACFFKDFKTLDIVDYMHEERAYIETKPGEVISYEFAKELRDFKNREMA